MTLGEYLVALLERYGVDTVFGIPGVHTVEMYRGLAASPIRHVTPRHEQAAAFMADGYARVSGKPGVCLLITGPGLTNAVTAMAQAYAESVPMLVISAVNKIGQIGHGEGILHESQDQSRLAAQVSAFSFRVLAPGDLPRAVARAFAIFEGARPRPVHIEIPVDLFSAPADGLDVSRVAPIRPARPAADAVADAARALASAERPVLLLGGGAVRGAPSARALAERLDAPAAMTVNARGVLPAGHPLGVPASGSLAALRALVAEADVVIAAGTELGGTDYDMFDAAPFEIPCPLIRLDIEAEQLMRNARPEIPLLGDAGAGLADLLAALPPDRPAGDGPVRAARARAAAWAELSPDYRGMVAVLDAMRDAVPDAFFVGDSTQPVYAGNLYFDAATPGSWFNAATGFGALGFGLPAAVGARLAAPDRPVICLAGDGGLQFTLAELGTAMEVGGPLVIVVWNNEGYGEIKTSMVASGVAPVGVDLLTPDFQAIGAAYGLGTVAVSDPAAVVSEVASCAAAGRPALVELRLPRTPG